jgi:uncharacterized protein (TIGR02391 family)
MASFLRRFPARQDVVLVNNPGLDNEIRQTVLAVVQPDKGFFEIDTPIHEGDVVEVPDPRAGTVEPRRLMVARVDLHELPQKPFMSHIEVSWGTAPQLRTAAIRRLGIEALHPAVVKAASDLFTDSHYASAIFEAFKAVEGRVRSMSGIDESGKQLMGRAFSGTPPPINRATEPGRSGEDEQEGFKLLFIGAMQGIRNPKGHEPVSQQDPQRALEYLAVASLLMRRLDDAARST